MLNLGIEKFTPTWLELGTFRDIQIKLRKKTSSFREPTAQDLALKNIQIHPILGPEILKKKQPESRILLCTVRSYLNDTSI